LIKDKTGTLCIREAEVLLLFYTGQLYIICFWYKIGILDSLRFVREV